MTHQKKEKLYFFTPLIVVLFPTFPNNFSMGVQFLFVLEMVLMILFYIMGLYRLPKESYGVQITCYFFFATAISIALDLIRGNLILPDLFELSRPIAFFCFYAWYRYSNIDIESVEKQTLKLIVILFLIEASYSIIEFYFLEETLPFSYLFYKKEEMIIFRDKAIGTFSQIYAYGYILLLPFVLFLMKFLQKKRLISLTQFLAIAFALLLTQSKSIYISAALCVILSFCVSIFYSTLKSGIINILLISAILVSAIYYYFIYQEYLFDTFAYASQGLQSIMDGEGGTVKTRLWQIDWAINNNPLVLLGGGIGKNEIMLESLYGLYYYRYGFIGLAIFLFVIFYTSKSAYKIANSLQSKSENSELSVFYYALSIFYFVTPLALSSSCHHDTPKVSILFYGLMGLVHAKYNKIKFL